MGILSQAKKYKIYNITLAPKAILGLVVLLAVIIIIAVSLIGIYTNERSRTGIDKDPEANNIGNWEYIDKDYILKKFETLDIDGKKIGAVTLRDNKNGNKLVVLQIEFTSSEIAKIKEEVLNKFLAVYGLGDSFFKGSGTTGKYGEEIYYRTVGWKSIAGEKTGIIGNIDCFLGNGNTSSIFLVAVNILDDYDNSRVLEFANTLNCPKIIDDNANNDAQDKLDTDADGLIDKVEKMLHTNSYNADTDGDGTNDGNEIKVGRNPSKHKQWQDVFPVEEFDKVKRDIKFISIYNHDKLFLGY